MSETTKYKALIIEPDPEFASLIETGVAQYKYNISIIADGLKGFQYFSENQPELIVLEWNIPGMSGIELCQKIRETETGRYTTILMFSTRNEPEEMETAIKAGVNYFLNKPIDPRMFGAWLSAADKEVRDQSDLCESDRMIGSYKDELEDANFQLQDSITRANCLAMEAELAYVELNQIFNSAADGIRVIDLEHNVVRSNNTFHEISGLALADIQDKKCYETFECSLFNTDDCPIPNIENGAERIEIEIQRVRPQGDLGYYNITSTPFKAPDGDLVGVVEYILDITDRKKAEADLRRSEERFRTVSERAPFGQSILRPDQTFEYFNPKFIEVFGYNLHQIPNLDTWHELAFPDPEYRDYVISTWNFFLQEDDESESDGQLVFNVICNDGQEKIIDFRGVTLDDGKIFVTYVDITARVKAEEALRESERRYMELSIIDDLTKLFNKRYFNEQLSREIVRNRRYGNPLSMLLMDIDNFKHFNDTYGHTEGDKVLAVLGEVIAEDIRKTDSGFRYGGEEFCIILAETDGPGALIVAERIRNKFRDISFQVSAQEMVHKTVSIGVTQYNPGEDMETFVARADKHMYEAKNSGKDKVVLR
jgi:diguanylate cyclase (GGDEF)-like protein/PAS domain S-box-containing protein